MYEDSIQELNILIGELDSFQKEHEQKQASKCTNSSSIIVAAVCDYESNYDIDKLSIDSSNMGSSYGYSIHSNCSDSDHQPSIQHTSQPLPPPPAVVNHFNYSDTEINRYMHEKSENSISISNNDSNSEIIHLQDSSLNQTELYVKENAEIVVLRRKDSIVTAANSFDKIDGNDYLYGGQHQQNQPELLQQRFSSFKSNDCNALPSSISLPPPPISSSSSSSIQLSNNNHYTRDDYKIVRLNMKNMEKTSLSLPPIVTVSVHDTELNSHNCLKTNSNERLFNNKPLVSPRPTSLAGLLFCFIFIFSQFYSI